MVQFIEEEYISLDEKLDLAVCSVEVCIFYFWYSRFYLFHLFVSQYLIQKYEEAKKENDERFLRAVRDCHRVARKILERPETKTRIESFLVSRKAELKRKRFFKILNPMLSYFETYGAGDYVGEMIGGWLPQLTSARSMRAIEGPRPDSSSDALSPTDARWFEFVTCLRKLVFQLSQYLFANVVKWSLAACPENFLKVPKV